MSILSEARIALWHAEGNGLMLPGEVASLFRVDPKTVSRWAAAGKIPAFRTAGGRWRFRESDIRPLLESWSP